MTKKFQSTPPRGGRPYPNLKASKARECFNPRPRAGGDAGYIESVAAGGVSIHAPARGATQPPRRTPGRGKFQSTPPRGGRRQHLVRLNVVARVSIHAPARGATKRGFKLLEA